MRAVGQTANPIGWLLVSKVDGWRKVVEQPTDDDAYFCIPLYYPIPPRPCDALLACLEDIATFCEARPLYGQSNAHSTIVAHKARAALMNHSVIEGKAND